VREKKNYNLPLTGKARTLSPVSGDEGDPIRPINIMPRVVEMVVRKVLGLLPAEPLPEESDVLESAFIWHLIDIDLENGLAVIELEADTVLHEILEDLLFNNTRKELFELTEEKELEKPLV